MPDSLFASVPALFAAETGTTELWTDRQVIELQIKVLAGIIVPLATGVWLLLKYMHSARIRNLMVRAQEAQEAAATERRLKESLARNAEKLPEAIVDNSFDKILQELESARETAVELSRSLATANTQSEAERRQSADLVAAMNASLAKVDIEVVSYRRAIQSNDRRINRALKLEGQLWAAKSTLGVPRFRDMAWRQRPIISVGNLKGGVGKTTVTAHLAMALVRRGYRVLLVDLDLQGSLSSMLIPDARLAELKKRNLLVQHFFNCAVEDRKTKLQNYAHPVFGGKIGLVPATDSLGYAELNLTMRWLLQSGQTDTRFLLRKALHLIGLGSNYDIVLVDCPPLLNISCINALAASDYVLIPVMPSRKVVERVPYLLQRLADAKFKRYLNPDLKVLGIVANRTYRDRLTADEAREINDYMPSACKTVWGQDVKRFETLIPQNAREIRDTEHVFELPKAGGGLAESFESLTDEILKELPSDCLQPARPFVEPDRVPQPVASQSQSQGTGTAPGSSQTLRSI